MPPELLFAFRLVPQRVHLVERCVFERAALARQRASRCRRSGARTWRWCGAAPFRIGADMAGQIDQREQEIADFVGDVRRRRRRRARPRSRRLSSRIFCSTARGSFQSKPTVEALLCSSIARISAGRPAFTADSSDVAPLCFAARCAARSAFSSALMRSQALGAGGVRCLPSLSAEHMRMAADHLRGDRLDHVAEGEARSAPPPCARDRRPAAADRRARREVVEIAARDRVGDLVGFLDGVGRDGLESLLEVPRAAGHRRAQRRHDLDAGVKCRGKGSWGIRPEPDWLYAASGAHPSETSRPDRTFHRLALTAR